MTAVIVALNSKYVHSSLAAWYLLAGAALYGAGGWTAEVLEGTINENLDAVAARIIEKTPKAIGFSCYIWNIAFVKKLLPVIKNALPDAVLILGGPEVSYNAGALLRDEPRIDYILSGEGEEPFALLLNALAAGRDGAGIPGVCFRRNGETVVPPPHHAPDDPPEPYTPAYLNTLNGRIAYLETSRGCPFSCAFCLSGREGRVRYFSPDRARRHILLLANSGTATVKLVDRTFNANSRRARELFGFILENYGTAIPQGVRFHFEIAGDLLDEETLALLRTAPKGLFQFEIGLQSFNEKTLDAIRRQTDTGRLRENIGRLIAFGNIHIHLDLIAGLPLEDLASFEESFNTAYGLRPHMLQLGFLKLLHGAPMRAEPECFPCSYAPAPPYEVTGTAWLTGDELRRLHAAEDAVERVLSSGRFPRTLSYVLERTEMTPFGFFMAAGAALSETAPARESLDDYTQRLYAFLVTLRGVDTLALRDAMVCDRLATNSAGRLPPVLMIRDARTKAVMTGLRRRAETRPRQGVKRGFALLASENAAVWVDYEDRDPVTGEYALHRIPLEKLL